MCHPPPPKVVDFFRTVNKDAHQLKRIGSDGVQGCGGIILGALASCLRRVGIGNPGAAVENMAFGTDDPLDFSAKKAAGGGGRPRSGSGVVGGGRAGSVRGSFVSGDYALEEELEEDDEEADQEELSAQVCACVCLCLCVCPPCCGWDGMLSTPCVC